MALPLTVVDTTVIIDILRGSPPAIDLASTVPRRLVASEVTRVEILRGLRSHERGAAERAFTAFRWVAMDGSIARWAGELGWRWRRSHRDVSTADLVIAATAMEDHPGIAFRDGPAGRRAALAGGPDVWEVIATLQGTGLSGEKAVAATATWGSLTPAQVRMAVRYYADYRDEVDERIAFNRSEAERQRRAWQRMQDCTWLKLLLDEMVPAVVAERLRARGHDVVAVTERPELRSLPDADVFAAGQAERRAVVTESIADFVAVVDAADQRGGAHFGLVLVDPAKYPRGRPRTIGRMVTSLDRLLREHPGERATSMRHWP